MIRFAVCVLALALGVQAAMAERLNGQQTYDLLFRAGTLDTVAPKGRLIYARAVQSPGNPDAAARDSGLIALSLGGGDDRLAVLDIRQGDTVRLLGSFPAGAGNPMIMYFYESTLRDMAEITGGSPHYIRNRMKEALVQPSDLEVGEAVVNGSLVATTTIRMHPFRDDPNQGRMQGFGDLELSITMSDAVPGWYAGFSAVAGDVYRSDVDFTALEDGA